MLIINGVNAAVTVSAAAGLMTAKTDPGASAAVTTAIVDAYAGVVITLTGAGNAQTLQSPTITTAGKIFTVVNNDTSTNTIAVNGITLAAGKSQSFIWDGSAWGPTDIGITAIPVPVAQGGTNSTTGNVSGLDFSTPPIIGGTTPNVVYGLTKEIYKTASADSPLTALQCSGTVVSNFGMTDADCVISLPTAAEGLAFLCVLPAVRARYFKLRAAATDKIYLAGTAGSDNGYVGVASGYATGSAASFFTFKASDGGFDWFVIPIFGAWVAS